MTNSYNMRYGYASILDPELMFTEKSAAQRHDFAQACVRLEGKFQSDFAAIITGDGDEKVIAALEWIVNAYDSVKTEKFLATYREKETASSIDAAVEAQQAAEREVKISEVENQESMNASCGA